MVEIPASADYVSDWSAKAKLSFLLGGQHSGKLTEIDLALQEQFRGGLKGINLQLEPTLMYINFNEDLPFNDAFYAGLSTGFDFGPYLGVRAFYLHALNESSLLSFNKSSVWGGETKFKLNVAHGIVPFLTLGGGRINMLDGYQSNNGLEPENKVFASGGLGLELPLSQRIKLMAFANGLLTSAHNLDELSTPESITTNVAYGVKAGFSIGKKQESTETILKKKLDGLQSEYAESKASEIERVTQEYEILLNEKNAEIAGKDAIIDSLNVSVLQADPVKSESAENESSLQKNASIIQITPDELISIMQEFKGLSALLNQQQTFHAGEKSIASQAENQPEELLADTLQELPAEITPVSELSKNDIIISIDTVFVYPEEELQVTNYELLLDKLNSMQESVDSMHKKFDAFSSNYSPDNEEVTTLIVGLKKQVESIEKMTTNLSRKMDATEPTAESFNKLMKELKETNRQVKTVSNKLQNLKITLEKSNKQHFVAPVLQVADEAFTEVADTVKRSSQKPVGHSGLSVFGGTGFGEDFIFNIGLRWKYALSNSHFSIVPETYIGIGSPAHLGLFVNGIYDFVMPKSNFIPYFGLGAGLMAPAHNASNNAFKGAFNIVLGSYIPQITDGFYIDFTTRNFLKYNQITVGYMLPY